MNRQMNGQASFRELAGECGLAWRNPRLGIGPSMAYNVEIEIQCHESSRLHGLCKGVAHASRQKVPIAKNGETTVLKAGKKFEQVSVNSLCDSEVPPATETYIQHRPTNSRRRSFAEQIKKVDKNKDDRIVNCDKEELRGLCSGSSRGSTVMETERSIRIN